MHFIYILFSEKLNRYYVGETSNPDTSGENRFAQHNQHYFTSNFTKSAEDWTPKLTFRCKNRTEALFLEKFIKKMKSKVFIKKIIKNPLILLDILKNNSP